MPVLIPKSDVLRMLRHQRDIWRECKRQWPKGSGRDTIGMAAEHLNVTIQAINEMEGHKP